MSTETILYQKERNGNRTSCRREDARRAAEELLLACGITPHLCGFAPLSEGVRITAERKRKRTGLMITELEQTMARLCGERGAEHAMRDAIGAGFLGTDGIRSQLFPYADRPSCAEFICTLAELVIDSISEES